MAVSGYVRIYLQWRNWRATREVCLSQRCPLLLGGAKIRSLAAHNEYLEASLNEVQTHEEKEEKVEVSGLPWKVHEELAWRIPSFRSPEKIQNMGEQRSHG